MKLGKGFRKAFRRYFLIGLIVFLPFAITIKFLIFIIKYFDSILEVSQGRFLYIIPASLHPDALIGIHIPGLWGAIFTILLILLCGALSRNYFGKRVIGYGDTAITRIPRVRVVYGVVKDAIQTFSKRDKSHFSKVVLIEYPRPGIYTLAFVTGDTSNEVQKAVGQKMINIFLPTTPNPTSGFYLMIPENKATPLSMSVEDAFKTIISGGMVSPDA